MSSLRFIFFFNATAPTEIYTLSLHDALPISPLRRDRLTRDPRLWRRPALTPRAAPRGGRRLTPGLPPTPTYEGPAPGGRSEEPTSGLQSPRQPVCRLRLAKKRRGGPKRAPAP